MNKATSEHSFTKNVLTLMTGTTIAQAIPLLISPILTRLYTPENFGLLAIYMSILAVISVFATGRYELSIVLPDKKIDAIHIIILSLGITLCVSILTMGIMYFFSDNISALLHNNKIQAWLFFLPISIISIGIFQSLTYWCTKNKKFKTIAHAKIMQSIVYALVTILIGLAGYGAEGLILGLIASQISMALYLLKDNIVEVLIGVKTVRKYKLLQLAQKYKKMPLLNLPNAFVDNVRLSGINIFIDKFYTHDMLGQYSLSWRMVQAPFAILGGSISQVFFQKLTQIPANKLSSSIYKVLYKLFLIAIIPFTIIYFYAEVIFGFVFGDNWIMAGKIASILTPWLFINFLTSPISSVFIVLNKQEVMLYFSLLYMITPLCILYFFHSMGMLAILHILTISMSILLVIFILLVLWHTKQYAISFEKTEVC